MILLAVLRLVLHIIGPMISPDYPHQESSSRFEIARCSIQARIKRNTLAT
jgi:hypothetical protein